MKDNQLIALIRAQIIAGLPAVGLTGLPVKQAYQPTQQGVPAEPSIFMFKIGDKRYGYRGATDVWDQVNDVEIHTETQFYETTFQISALSVQRPQDTTQLTAADIVNGVAYIVQSESFMDALKAQDVGLLRVMAVQNPYFADDRGRYEASPSFDFTVTHKQIVQTEVPVLESTEFRIRSV